MIFTVMFGYDENIWPKDDETVYVYLLLFEEGSSYEPQHFAVHLTSSSLVL